MSRGITMARKKIINDKFFDEESGDIIDKITREVERFGRARGESHSTC